MINLSRSTFKPSSKSPIHCFNLDRHSDFLISIIMSESVSCFQLIYLLIFKPRYAFNTLYKGLLQKSYKFKVNKLIHTFTLGRKIETDSAVAETKGCSQTVH